MPVYLAEAGATGGVSLATLDTLIAGLDIDHSLPVTSLYPPGRTAADERLVRLVADVLPGYASARNDATRADGASGCAGITTS